MSPIFWVGSPKFTAGHPAPLIALVHHRMVGTLGSTDAAFTSTDGREASTNFGVVYGCGRAGHPTSAHVHQYVRLGDQAWGNGNWGASGAWDDRYPTTQLNSRTVSIEHHDNGGRTAGSGKGVVPEAVIGASIALDALLLRGDPGELNGAGVRFRSGTETAITRELQAIPIDRHHVIDHHYIAGRLKPSCWRPWADDPVGFPQARYLAALAPAPPAPEETVNSYPVPKVPSIATVPAGTWLYATSALEPSPDNICVDPGRDMPYLGQPASTVRIVEWLRAIGEAIQTAEMAKEKADLMHAIYERITVAGHEIVGVRLTPAAYAHGLALALPEKVVMARPTGFNRGNAIHIRIPVETAGEAFASLGA